MDNQSAPKKFYKRTWFWVTVTIVSFIVGISSDKNVSPSAPTPQENSVKESPSQPVVQAIVVTADKLVSAYKDNEVAADATYKAKQVEISGTIKTIGKDITNAPYISFTTANEYEITSVQCMFSKDDEPALAKMLKGQQVSLRGEVSGKLGNIIVRGCSIVTQ